MARNDKNYDYWKYPQKPYPQTIFWTVVAPKGHQLSILEDHDIIFDDYDLKIRRLTK